MAPLELDVVLDHLDALEREQRVPHAHQVRAERARHHGRGSLLGGEPAERSQAIGGEARFGLSPGMIETVLCSLVQRGLVVVHDGIVEIAVPGLATIL